MEIIDIGANLTHDSFDSDRDEVLQRSRDAGIVQMIVTGASAQGSQVALAIAEAHPGELFATAGVHPHRASDYHDETDALLRELVTHDAVVAAGETGLDYFRDISPRNVQRDVFERQLQIGVDSGLPMFLHQRDGHTDFIAILREFRDQLKDAVVHCFTGSREEMYECLDLDCHIGITGWICDERRGHHLKEFVSDIPANRLMIESDSPYLKPRSLRPRVKTHRNEPQWLSWTLGVVAASRGETPGQTAAITTKTAREFFSLPVLQKMPDVDLRHTR
jgi:TatD DNase family protein